jgi:hypothetical protein
MGDLSLGEAWFVGQVFLGYLLAWLVISKDRGESEPLK